MPAIVKARVEKSTLGRRLLASMREAGEHLDDLPGDCVTVASPSWAYCVVELRKLRLAGGWTQAQIAKRSGLRLETISKLELGKILNPTLDTLDKYASALGTKIVYRLVTATVAKP